MKLKAEFETETYISDGGYYVIKQDNVKDTKSLIMLTRAQIEHVIADMQRSLEEVVWDDEEFSGE